MGSLLKTWGWSTGVLVVRPPRLTNIYAHCGEVVRWLQVHQLCASNQAHGEVPSRSGEKAWPVVRGCLEWRQYGL